MKFSAIALTLIMLGTGALCAADDAATMNESPTAVASVSPTALAMPDTTTAAAEPAGAVTLEDCFKAALKQSESYASQQEVLIQAQERYHQAIGSVLPTVNASALWFQEDGHSLPSYIPVTAQQTTYMATLQQPLFEGMRDYAALRSAKDSIAYNSLSVQAAALNLYSSVAITYYTVLSAEKDLDTQQKEVDLYKGRITELRNFVQIGRSQVTDILTVQAALATLVAQIEQAKAQVAVAQELFTFLTGLPADTVLVNDTQGLSVDSMENYLTSIDNRPDILADTESIKIAKEAVNIEWGQHLPNLNLSADYYFQRPEGLTQNVDWDAELALNVPLFAGGTVHYEVQQAQSQVRQAELALQMEKRLDIEAVRSAYENFQYDQSQVTALIAAADLNEKDYKAEVVDYGNGLVTNQDVLTALTNFEEEKRTLDKEIFATKSDFANLQALTAKIKIPEEGAN